MSAPADSSNAIRWLLETDTHLVERIEQLRTAKERGFESVVSLGLAPPLVMEPMRRDEDDFANSLAALSREASPEPRLAEIRTTPVDRQLDVYRAATSLSFAAAERRRIFEDAARQGFSHYVELIPSPEMGWLPTASVAGANETALVGFTSARHDVIEDNLTSTIMTVDEALDEAGMDLLRRLLHYTAAELISGYVVITLPKVKPTARRTLLAYYDEPKLHKLADACWTLGESDQEPAFDMAAHAKLETSLRTSILLFKRQGETLSYWRRGIPSFFPDYILELAEELGLAKDDPIACRWIDNLIPQTSDSPEVVKDKGKFLLEPIQKPAVLATIWARAFTLNAKELLVQKQRREQEGR